MTIAIWQRQVEAVREEIYRMKGRDPAAKVIIFSQFTSMLDILHYRLTQVRPLPSSHWCARVCIAA